MLAITSTGMDSAVGSKIPATSMFIYALGARFFFLRFEEPVAAFPLFTTIVYLKFLRFGRLGALTLDAVSVVEPRTELGNTCLISTTNGTNG